ETRKELSWIWTTSSISLQDGANENNNEILWGEWCRSQARALRLSEEVLLLHEEMHRMAAFLVWKEKQWKEWMVVRASMCDNLESALVEGLTAYARKQA
ncbi:hypothetical protein BT96DRAFT_777192, partial [Gymnopus androsaceus JB14]